MQTADKVIFHPDTAIGWNALPAEEKEYVLTTLERLAGQPPGQWPRDVAKHLNTPEPLYVLYALGGQLFIVFRRADDGTLTVLDMVHRKTIELHFLGKGPNGSQA